MAGRFTVRDASTSASSQTPQRPRARDCGRCRRRHYRRRQVARARWARHVSVCAPLKIRRCVPKTAMRRQGSSTNRQRKKRGRLCKFAISCNCNGSDRHSTALDTRYPPPKVQVHSTPTRQRDNHRSSLSTALTLLILCYTACATAQSHSRRDAQCTTRTRKQRVTQRSAPASPRARAGGA